MRILLTVWMALLAGCATGYGASGIGGGYSDTQLDKNVWRVSFYGNAFTAGERASNLALLRAAELTLSNGYRYFAVLDAASRNSVSTHATPTHTRGSVDGYGNVRATTSGGDVHVIEKPGRELTIMGFLERPENAPTLIYDARFVAASISTQYGIELKHPAKNPERQVAVAAPTHSIQPAQLCSRDADCGRGLECGSTYRCELPAASAAAAQ